MHCCVPGMLSSYLRMASAELSMRKAISACMALLSVVRQEGLCKKHAPCQVPYLIILPFILLASVWS